MVKNFFVLNAVVALSKNLGQCHSAFLLCMDGVAKGFSFIIVTVAIIGFIMWSLSACTQ